MSWGWIWDVINTGAGLYNSYRQSEDIKKAGTRESEEVQRVAEDNKAISLYDADVVEKSAREQAYRNGIELMIETRNMKQYMGALKASMAKSGVSLSSGTPVDIEVYSQQSFIQDLEMIKYNGKKAEEKQRELAERYRLLADKGMRDSAVWAATILDTAKDKSNSTLIYGITNALAKLSQAFEEK
jgi:hypothetical protein